MPNNDGTGPEGEGPKTGRGLGDCEEPEETTEPEETAPEPAEENVEEELAETSETETTSEDTE